MDQETFYMMVVAARSLEQDHKMHIIISTKKKKRNV